MKNSFFIILFLWIALLWGACSSALAQTSYMFDCMDSKINASIKYSIIGRYQASFSECSGEITYDDIKNQPTAVRLEVKINSIGSNCGWCDKIVLSKQLLDAEAYPLIVFQSQSFLKNGTSHEVAGSLDLHGVTGELKSPFSIEQFIDPKDNKPYMRMNGEWAINRRDFGISWNKVLDRGGVLVGNMINVSWKVLVKK